MDETDSQIEILESAFDEEDALEKNDLVLHFLNACDRDNIEIIQQCLKQGVDPNAHQNFNCALHRTSRNGYLRATQLLVAQSKIRINFKNEFGSTALILAADRNKFDICRILVRAGANVHLTDKLGYTALHRAIHWRSTNIVALLLRFRANPNVENVFLRTPLDIAAVDSISLKIVSLLIEFGADVNRNKNNIMPVLLECAICCSIPKQLAVIEYLLNNGANIDIQDMSTHRTALHIVALSGYAPLAVLLLNRGANANLVDRFQHRAIDVAIHNHNQNIVKLLLPFAL